MLSAANRKSGVSVLVDRKWHLRPAGSTITESSVPPESRCLIWLVWSFQSMKWHTSLGIKSLLRQAWNLLEWQSVVLIRCDDSQTEPSCPPGSNVGRIEGRAGPPSTVEEPVRLSLSPRGLWEVWLDLDLCHWVTLGVFCISLFYLVGVPHGGPHGRALCVQTVQYVPELSQDRRPKEPKQRDRTRITIVSMQPSQTE